MTFILAASGKKQSGKDTLLNGLRPFLETYGVVKTYSFADCLKDFLIKGLGLSYQQVWGTDADKNSLTTYMWDNIPYFIRWDFAGRWRAYGQGNREQIPMMEDSPVIESEFWRLVNKSEICWEDLRIGAMTARELMQVYGTDVMRRMFGDAIWVNALSRSIDQDKPDIAVIPDLRFPSELKPIYALNGHIVRLLRDVSRGDQHPSEISLDGWDWSSYERAIVIPADSDAESCRQITMDWLTSRLKRE